MVYTNILQRTGIENKKYPPKNNYYTPVFLHPYTFAGKN